MKLCSKCQTIKPLVDFSTRQSHCKPCKRAHYRANPLAYRERNLQSRYGMTLEQYDTLLASQGGVCAVCGRPPSGPYSLSVDHDHSCCPKTPTCGACTRGLLCRTDNRAAGLLGDDPAAVRRLLNYLEGWFDEPEQSED